MQTESHDEVELQNRYGAIIRSLSGDTHLQIRDWHLFHKSLALNALAPHLNFNYLQASWADPRGVLDGVALRLRHSDYELHLWPMAEWKGASVFYCFLFSRQSGSN